MSEAKLSQTFELLDQDGALLMGSECCEEAVGRDQRGGNRSHRRLHHLVVDVIHA